MKLLERVNAMGLRRHLAASTISCYQAWIRDFLRYHRHGERWRTPDELAANGGGDLRMVQQIAWGISAWWNA